MKTVLTEFQHRIPDASQIKQYISQNDPDEKMLDEWLYDTIYKGIDWLEKERQQIIEAGNKCAFRQHLHEAEIDKMKADELLEFLNKNTKTVGEDYYDKTFS